MNRILLWKIAFATIALILVFLMVYSGLRILESTVFLKEQEQGPTRSRTLTLNGVDYYPRQDIFVVLLMGIDQAGEVKPAEKGHWAEAVDMITLLIFDEKAQDLTLLSLNRDTMLEMPVLNDQGWEEGTFYGQLAQSHMYGTGLEDSCENTKETVSRFLNGLYIDYYLAMNMDAVGILNDAVGGVTVNVEDDFSAVDATLLQGIQKLNGDQAITFVQTRRNVGDELNTSRIRRQQVYMESFARQLREKADEDSTFVLKSYEKISPYIVTNCSANVLSGIVERYGDYTLKENVTPEGRNVVGEYMEFHVDEEKLKELVVRLFYAPKG